MLGGARLRWASQPNVSDAASINDASQLSAAGMFGRDVLKRGAGLSATDRELIRLLQIDGRMPYVDLGRAVGASEKSVRMRVRELREAGIIYITTVSNPEILGYETAAFLCITCDGRSPSELAAEIALIDAVDYVIVTTGRFDLMVEVFCAGLTDLREVVETRVRTIPGVAAVEVLPFLSIEFQQGAFARGEGSELPQVKPSVEPPTQVDRDIVAQLSRDGRMSLYTVANRIGVSEAQVRRRLTRMRAAGAVVIMAITNPMTLGFDTIAIVGIRLAKHSSSAEVAAELSRLSPVSYVAICAGRYDLLVELVCFTPADLQALLDEQVRPLEGVERLEPFLYLGLHYKPLRPATGREAGTLFAF
jgi:DNA-binding Lrp family transcriptional regulator